MEVRMATVDEMKKLWEYSNSPTYNYFVKGIESGNIEFWTVENDVDRTLIGELYIFWDSEDKDEANGKTRAYLCALRVKEEFRGKGLASKLMNNVLKRIKDNGFNEVTIGVDNADYERLKSVYKSWGFTDLIKKQHYDYHYLDSNNKPVYFEEASDLYLNKLA